MVDTAAVKAWVAQVRASVQRLAQPQELEPAPVGVVRRPSGAPVGAVVVHDADDVAQELTAAGILTLSVATADADPPADVLLRGRSPLALMVDRTLAAVRWLSEEEGVKRVGLHGAGDGAAVALHAALLHPEPLPLAVSGHLGRYSDLAVQGVLALPGILRYADLPDLYAALAPRPFLISEAPQEVLDAFGAFGAAVSDGSVVSFFADALRQTPPMPFIPPLKVVFDLSARAEVADRIDQVLASGMLTQGKLVGEFEEMARKHTGVEAIAVSTGTAALDIAYQLLDVRDKTVLVPVNTFFATAASVERVGGKVEFVDIELDNFGMDPQALREALDRHDDVAAVAVVHIGGVIAPSFKEVLAECAARGIPVIEDAAHALGSRLDGALAGTFGEMATYSLHPAKVATSGEGGFFGAKDPAMLEAARKLRDHGKISISQNIHDRLGNNWRLSEVHAAVGLAHFARLDGLLDMRRKLAAWYDEHLDSVPGIKRYHLPQGVESNYYKYMAFLDPDVDRAELKARLRQRHGVALAGEVYDVLLSDQPYFAERFRGRDFERAQWFAAHHICLPTFPSMTTAEQKHVLHALRTELS
jgi:dTDP-4-amino-4,6-dideoxygalactose transaminase